MPIPRKSCVPSRGKRTILNMLLAHNDVAVSALDNRP